MNLQYTTLRLHAPLYYVPDPALEPFCFPGGEELALAFELDSETGQSIEPGEERYLAEPLWLGKAAEAAEAGAAETAAMPGIPGGFCIPRGVYFFSQIRELPGRDEWIRFAIEVQKEGLWRRNRLGGRLYLRAVYEDGAAAQIFRECL
ncbi:MAG: hypothetical protein LBK40_00425 [Spirochaetaceae bacterium]|nr:hypothetical protein [Spirochaetaceae bacterium]